MCFIFVGHGKKKKLQISVPATSDLFFLNHQNTLSRYYHPNLTYTESKTESINDLSNATGVIK